MKPNVLIPASVTLDALLSRPWKEGVQINELQAFDTLIIDTLNHEYEMTVIDPETAQVLVRGGEVFPEPTLAKVAGASLRSSFLKLHGIYIGFHIELFVDRERIITSRVRSIRMLSGPRLDSTGAITDPNKMVVCPYEFGRAAQRCN